MGNTAPLAGRAVIGESELIVVLDTLGAVISLEELNLLLYFEA